MSQYVLIMGGPGAGKGTQSEKLQKSLGVPHVSTGDIFREHIEQQTEVGQEIKNLLDQGRFAPDEIACRVVEERLADEDCEDGCVLDGFPRSVAQAETLDEILAALGGAVNIVINLEVSDDEVVSRLTKRRTCPSCGAIYNLAFNPPAIEGRCDNPTCEGTELLQREDDKEDVIRRRIRIYHEKTEPLLKYYEQKNVLRSVRAEGMAPDAIFEKIESLFGTPDAVGK